MAYFPKVIFNHIDNFVNCLVVVLTFYCNVAGMWTAALLEESTVLGEWGRQAGFHHVFHVLQHVENVRQLAGRFFCSSHGHQSRKLE